MLKLSIGQFSSAGEKPENQDSYGFRLPAGDLLTFKGAAVALADGISTSSVSHIASQVSVKQFLEDYFCTSDTWSVPKAAEQVIKAVNRWLLGQTHNSQFAGEPDKGYVCTFSALIFKHDLVHSFHLGDARIYRLRGRVLEQLTHEHREYVNSQQHYLANALGVHHDVKIDVSSRRTAQGDCFILITDGVYEHVDDGAICQIVHGNRDAPELAAQMLVETAFGNGSTDNLTAQVVWVNDVPLQQTLQIITGIDELPIPPVLEVGNKIDQFDVLRVLHSSARSHVYLVKDTISNKQVVVKAPSIEMAGQEAHLDAFRMEEWIARRVKSRYVVGAPEQRFAKTAFYSVTNYVAGKSLAQWLEDNPQPDLDTVRLIIEQVARALMALHRKDVLHRDLRPENVMINEHSAVTLIDLGAASVAGINEFIDSEDVVPGTAIYAAPEYFLGQAGSEYSDQFSLAVMTYYMLSGRYPYGIDVAKCRSVTAQRKLKYASVLDADRSIPFWLDHTLKRALQPNPVKRYNVLSEFIHELHHPNPAFLRRERPPLVKRNPVAFWQGVSAVLLCLVLFLLFEKFQ